MLLEDYKEIIEAKKPKFKKGDYIKSDGRIYQIVDIRYYEDGNGYYIVKDEYGREDPPYIMDVIDKTAVKSRKEGSIPGETIEYNGKKWLIIDKSYDKKNKVYRFYLKNKKTGQEIHMASDILL